MKLSNKSNDSDLNQGLTKPVFAQTFDFVTITKSIEVHTKRAHVSLLTDGDKNKF